MTLKKNIFANYIGTGIAAFLPILVLPLYLATLGPKQFGLISFVVTLQAVLGLVDAGMSQALVREIAARFSMANGGGRSPAALLFGFERIYWLFAMFAGFVTLLLANSIANHWLKIGDMPPELGRYAIYGAAAIFAVQFPGSIYRSLLVGAQAQVSLNVIILGGALLRHVGGVFVISIWPTLPAYLIWQTIIAFMETLVRARLAWSILNVKRSQVVWDMKEIGSMWALVAGMSGATWLGALTVQMDKIVLSRMASIEDFGYYVVAATASAGVLQLIYPLVQAILPRAVQLRAEPVALRKLNLKLAKLIGAIMGLVAMGFVILGKTLLEIWLRNPQAVKAIYPLLAILLVGTCLNAFYNVGYINWIVHEKIHRVFQVNILALVLSVVLIPPLVVWQGTIGAAFGWLAINLIGFTLSIEWLKRE